MSRSHWRILGGLIAPHRRSFVAYGVLMAVATAVPIAASFAFARFVGLAVAGGTGGALVRLGLTFAALGLVSTLLTLVVTWRSNVLAWQLTNGLRRRLAAVVLDADLSFHREHSPGEMLTRCDSDVTSLTIFLGTVVSRLLGIALLAIAAVVALAVAEPLMAPVAAVGLGWLGYRGWATRDHVTAVVTEERAIDAEMTGIAEEYLAAAEEVAGLGAEAHVTERYGGTAARLVAAMARRSRTEMKVNTELRLLARGSQILVLLVGGLALGAGSIDVEGVVLAYRLLDVVRNPLERLTWRLLETQGVSGAAKRVAEVLQMEADRPVRTAVLPPGPLDLTWSEVDFAYDDAGPDEWALTGVDLSVAAGRCLGVLGRTGSGKTTMARLAQGLAAPTRGSVRLGSTDVSTVDEADLRARLGAIPQEVQLFPGTVRDNVALFGEADDDAIREALSAAGLDGWLDGLPGGLDTRLRPDGRSADSDRGEGRGVGVSAGEAQLLSIARSLLRDPSVVVLDEATARVDPQTQIAIERALARLLVGRTAVVIAHRLETLETCDDIAVMDGGRIVEHGPRADLAADPTSRYYRLLRVGATAEELQ